MSTMQYEDGIEKVFKYMDKSQKLLGITIDEIAGRSHQSDCINIYVTILLIEIEDFSVVDFSTASE